MNIVMAQVQYQCIHPEWAKRTALPRRAGDVGPGGLRAAGLLIFFYGNPSRQDAVVCLYGIPGCKSESELAWTCVVRICTCFCKYREKESLEHQPMLFMTFKRAP